jgi:predicted nucleotidyltransferase component of viral defense system
LDIKNNEEQLKMKDFIKLSKRDKLNIFNQTSERSGLPSSAVEKDWWVTLSLNIIFSLPYSNHIIFKGGTSLSKALQPPFSF